MAHRNSNAARSGTLGAIVLAGLGLMALVAWAVQPMPSVAVAQEQPAALTDGRPLETLIVAGGCFWCVESDFDSVPGVLKTVSGYTGGKTTNPTYQNHKGHLEAVKITYDPSVVSFEKLTNLFWRTIDPTDGGGQFCDRGHNYTTAIFYGSAKEKAVVERQKASIEASGKLGKPIKTAIRGEVAFYDAEGYHQNFYKTNPWHYRRYRAGCRRDQRTKQLWGDEAWAALKKHS